jgi:hypothetical protein
VLAAFHDRVATADASLLHQGTIIPKLSAFDTQFVTRNDDGELSQVQVPAGTPVAVNVVGLHYNRK